MTELEHENFYRENLEREILFFVFVKESKFLLRRRCVFTTKANLPQKFTKESTESNTSITQF